MNNENFQRMHAIESKILEQGMEALYWFTLRPLINERYGLTFGEQPMNEFDQIKKDIEESIKARGYVHITIIDRWMAYTERLIMQQYTERREASPEPPKSITGAKLASAQSGLDTKLSVLKDQNRSIG